MIPVFSKPTHILEKAIRDARTMNYAKNEQAAADALFNFCVTCHSLRDWCLKADGTLNASNEHEDWNKIPSLAIASDIANSSKHSGLNRPPKIIGVQRNTIKVLNFPPDRLDEIRQTLANNPDAFNDDLIEKPSFEIVLSDGTKVSTTDLSTQAIDFWISYFDSKQIDRKSTINAGQVFFHPDLDIDTKSDQPAAK
jgi:hypothetical protein